MSDTPLGDGWWLATDGLYYPPERHPDYRSPQSASGPLGKNTDEQMHTVDLSHPDGWLDGDSSPEEHNSELSRDTPHQPRVVLPTSHTSWGSPPTYPDPSVGGIPIGSDLTGGHRPDEDPTGGVAVVTKQRVVTPPKRKVGLVLLVVLVLAIGIGVGLGLSRLGGRDEPDVDADPTLNGTTTAIEDAASKCGAGGNVGDGGTSVSFDTEGKEDYSGDELSVVVCVLQSLDMPDRVRSRIDHTRALDGTLDASWGDYEAFWNYHPDSGLSITVYIPD